MTNKERHEKERARVKAYFSKKSLGTTTISKDAKTATTTNKGWSITTGVQKKTQPIPQPKAVNIPSTQGKALTYGKGQATVMDLGHAPSQKKIDSATNKLRGTNSKSSIKLSTVKKATAPAPKPNTASAAPSVKKTPTTGTSTTNLVIGGLGLAAAAGATAGSLKARKAKQVKAPTTTGVKAEVAASKQAVSRAPAIKAAKDAVLASKKDLSMRHEARRAKQGTQLKYAFEAVERADARAAAKPRPAVKPTPIQAHGVGAYTVADLNKIDERRTAERRASARRGAGFGATEAEVAKVAKSGEAVKAPSVAKKAAIKKTVAAAPKEVQKMVKEIEKATSKERFKAVVRLLPRLRLHLKPLRL